MTLTNQDRGPAVTAQRVVRRASYQGLCGCGADLQVSVAADSIERGDRVLDTALGAIEWRPQDLERDGLPRTVAVDHAQCTKPPSRLARERSVLRTGAAR